VIGPVVAYRGRHTVNGLPQAGAFEVISRSL